MNRKPLTIADGQLRQLQAGEGLDIPLEERFAALQRQFRLLLLHLCNVGFEIPSVLVEEAALTEQGDADGF